MAADDTFGWVASANQGLVAPHAEYFRKNRWVLEIGLPEQIADAVGGGDGPTVLRLHCSTASRPQIEFEESEVHRINGRVYLAGKPSFQPLSVNFYDNLPFNQLEEDPGAAGQDTLQHSVSQVMEAWRQAIYQPTAGDAFGSVPRYKSAALLRLLAPQPIEPQTDGYEPENGDGRAYSASVAQSWAYVGLYPTNINYGDLDYSSSDVQSVEVSFRYDRAYMVPPGT